MNHPRESKFLRSIVRRLDCAPRSVWFVRRRLLLAWVLLVLLITVAFFVAPLLPSAISAAVFVGVGVIGATAYFRIVAIYGWSLLGPYIDRNAIQSRLRELGP